jgi:hypothetical protein
MSNVGRQKLEVLLTVERPRMPESTLFLSSLALGWVLGKAFLFLKLGRDSGNFTTKHWIVFLASLAGAMLFAKFGIGFAVRKFQINDIIVGASGIAVLAVFTGITFFGSRGGRV